MAGQRQRPLTLVVAFFVSNFPYILAFSGEACATSYDDCLPEVVLLQAALFTPLEAMALSAAVNWEDRAHLMPVFGTPSNITLATTRSEHHSPAITANGSSLRLSGVPYHNFYPGVDNTYPLQDPIGLGPDEDVWTYDKKATGDEGWQFFRAAPPKMWWLLAIVCVVFCLFDCWVLQTFTPSTFSGHIGALCFWVLCAGGYCIAVGCLMGAPKAAEWASGYILEWMLSMDNLFVFHLVFRSYKTPTEQMHKAVFVGIVGAIILRMVFFMAVSSLLHALNWVRYPFGLLLIYSGIEAARGGDDDEDEDAVQNTRLMRALRWLLGSRLYNGYHKSGAMFIFEDGYLQVTTLFVVIACLEISDVLFALDSVSAKVAQIPDQYIAFSSTIIAMYGLRAMFFIINDLVDMFEMLKYGLCLILIFIGFELMLSGLIHLSSLTVLIVIISVFFVSIAGSSASMHCGARDLENEGMEQKGGDERSESLESPESLKGPGRQAPTMPDAIPHASIGRPGEITT